MITSVHIWLQDEHSPPGTTPSLVSVINNLTLPGLPLVYFCVLLAFDPQSITHRDLIRVMERLIDSLAPAF